MLFRLLILISQSKKINYDTKIGEIKKKQKKRAQAKLAAKAGINDFVKDIDFHDKLKYIHKKVTLNKKETCTGSK